MTMPSLRLLRWIAAFAVALGPLGDGGKARAQQSAGGDFTLSRHTIDSGGGLAQAGQFSVTGSIAQPEADPLPAMGGPFVLEGGFWNNRLMETGADEIFRDGFESSTGGSANAGEPR